MIVHLKLFSTNISLWNPKDSRIPHTDELTHKVAVWVLADAKLSPFIDITLFDTQTYKKKLKSLPKTRPQ